MFDRVVKPIPAPASKERVSTAPRMTLTVEEMADELNISRATAYKLVKEDDFPAFRIGQRTLVNRKGLQEWIDKQCRTNPAA